MIPLWVYVFTIMIALLVIVMIGCASASGKISLEEEYNRALHTLSTEKNAEIEALKSEIYTLKNKQSTERI